MKSEMTQQKQTDDMRRNKYQENCQINTTDPSLLVLQPDSDWCPLNWSTQKKKKITCCELRLFHFLKGHVQFTDNPLYRHLYSHTFMFTA